MVGRSRETYDQATTLAEPSDGPTRLLFVSDPSLLFVSIPRNATLLYTRIILCHTRGERMPLPGYKRLPGKAERYRTPDGREISRRQYENIRYQERGWKSWSEYQRQRKVVNPRTGTNDYDRWRDALADEKGWSKRKAGMDPEFQRLYIEALRSDWKHDPEGPFAELLVYVGLRQPESDVDVGETNPP